MNTDTLKKPTVEERNAAIEAAFSKAEKKERTMLRKLFAQLGITDFSFTEAGTKERYDFIFEYKGIKYVGDIKCRNIPSSLYKDSLIDKSKIDFLKEKGKEIDARPLIIVAYTDNKICTWGLDRVTPKVQKKYCNRTTAVNRGKKMKEVCLFNLTDAVKYKINDTDKNA